MAYASSQPWVSSILHVQAACSCHQWIYQREVRKQLASPSSCLCQTPAERSPSVQLPSAIHEAMGGQKDTHTPVCPHIHSDTKEQLSLVISSCFGYQFELKSKIKSCNRVKKVFLVCDEGLIVAIGTGLWAEVFFYAHPPTQPWPHLETEKWLNFQTKRFERLRKQESVQGLCKTIRGLWDRE